MTVSKSQLSFAVIEYFQSFQVGCKHLKNIIWNQIPQSPSGVHQSFIDVYVFLLGFMISQAAVGLLASGWVKAQLYSSLFLLLLGSTHQGQGWQPGRTGLFARSPGARWQLGHRQEDFLLACLRGLALPAGWEAWLRYSVHPEHSTAASPGNPSLIPHLKALPHQRDKKIHSACIAICIPSSSLRSDGVEGFFQRY